MKKFVKWFIYSTLLVIILGGIGAGIYYKDRLWLIAKYFEKGTETPADLDPQKSTISLENRAKEAYEYAKANDLDLDHAVLIDFSRHSGKNRFFVWNFKENKPEIESLVAHGYGNTGFESTNQKIVFSNTPNSYASSLGKYTLGERSYSKWGINIHYKMHGLEQTNNNAFKRYIVLHSYKMIPDEETYPSYLPLGFSQGCPVIDDETMRKVDKLLQTKKKPVLLWIYYLE